MSPPDPIDVRSCHGRALAVAHLSAGRTREAAAVCKRALTLGRQHRSGLPWETSLLAWLALARLMDGDPAAADEAVAAARGRAARVDECFALLVRGRWRRPQAPATGRSRTSTPPSPWWPRSVL
jgi:hypothetical protein